ncbi:MAG: hypothetical protein GY940_28185 [bacterium]|nr:hypothetical protein [bacterium]
MKKIIVYLLIGVLVLFAFSVSATAAALDHSILPADTQWVMHVDMELFNKTWIKKAMMEKHDFLKLHKIEGKLAKYADINFFEDVDSLTLFGSSSHDDNEMVCVASGNFDSSDLMRLLEEHTPKEHDKTKYGKHTIINWGRSNHAVFTDKNRIAFSRSEESLKNVVDTLRGKKKNAASTELKEYIRMIPSNAFVSAAANDISSLNKGKSGYPGVILKETGMASFIAMENNKNLTLNVMLNTNSPETSGQIKSIVNGLIAMSNIKLQQDKNHRLSKLLDAVKISTQGSTVRLNFSYPSEELMELLAEKTHISMHID